MNRRLFIRALLGLASLPVVSKLPAGSLSKPGIIQAPLTDPDAWYIVGSTRTAALARSLTLTKEASFAKALWPGIKKWYEKEYEQHTSW